MPRRRFGVFLDPKEGPIKQFARGELALMWRLDAVARERNLYTHVGEAKNLLLTDGPEIPV